MHSDAYILPFLLCFSLLFFTELFVRPPQTAILLFCISFPWRWSWSLSPVQCHTIHSSSGTLSIRSRPLNLFLTSTVQSLGIWFRSYLNGLVVLPTFFNLNLNLAIRSSWSEPQSAPGLVFLDYIELLHLSLQRIYNLISVLTIWWCPCIESSLVLLEECLLWPVYFLGKTPLAFALLHPVFQAQICLLLQVFLDFLLLHSSPL